MASRGSPDAERAIGAAFRRATDRTGDAWAVFEARRDLGGELVDLVLRYGNDAYWALTGLSREAALDRGVGEANPALDRERGMAAILFATMSSGRDLMDDRVRVQPQLGPFAGEDRVYEVELTVSGDMLAAGFRDITKDVLAAEALAAEARRQAALARFLAVTVDPSISRSDLLDTLASELAATIGNLCAIVETGTDGTIRVIAVAGGPGDVAAEIRRTHLDRPASLPPDISSGYAGQTIFLRSIPPDIRERVAASIRWMGLPDELAATMSGMMLVPIPGEGGLKGRIHLERFADDPTYTAEDLATVEAIASAAALVLERRDVEHELSTALARFEAIFDQTPVPMVMIEAGVGRFNRAVETVFGRDREEIGRYMLTPNPPWMPKDQVAIYTELRRRTAQGEAVRGEMFSIVRPDGERRELEAVSLPFRGRDGSVIGSIIAFLDQTERLSLEAQLRHAQKMEALGRLAGGIAHDFNNVLMAILGHAEFLAADAREGRASASDADQVVSATRKAIDLTARLTTFARREAVRREPTYLADLIDEIMPLVTRLAPESVEIVTGLQSGPPVLIDRSEFEQAVVNLVVNAIDAMPRGGRLTIETGASDHGPEVLHANHGRRPGPYAVLAVSDTGIGMDEATRSRIFEPFYTTKGVGEGTGLGLSMAFAAVERAEGSIWVYSEPDVGTTFRIHLPRAEDETPQATQDAPDRSVVAGGTESILLVEDDPMVRDLVAVGLRKHGYKVSVAEHPAAALDLAASDDFAVVVSDVVMPGMTGIEMAAQLRTSRPDLPMILMSGYTALALQFEPGPRDYLAAKPISPDELARVVRLAIDGARPAGDAEVGRTSERS